MDRPPVPQLIPGRDQAAKIFRQDFGFKTFYCWSNSCYWFPVVREAFSSFHFGNVTLRLSFCFFFFPSVMNSLGNNLKDSLLCLRKCLKLLCCFFTDY
ncbi:hypothetical protein NC653_011879 [Populus alba x Populus x berolinensis]|uniref:Uncharacterized protein n=1 Tax=Populus alba x Populus x berolinensis TaxID=444605 RepID=A0AAD6R3K6_9ROSI|nr:hypothetical protein NC653_011879 [Populus alba x Populus x berolinensis]